MFTKRSNARPRSAVAVAAAAAGALVAALLCSIVGTSGPAAAACTTAPAAPAVPAGITGYLNNRKTGVDAVKAKLLDLINGANTGDIRLVEFKLTDTTVAQALINASCRGVHVKVILDSEMNPAYHDPKDNYTNAAWDMLDTALGNNIDNASWVITCPNGEACLSHAADTINHNKFATFESSGTATNIVYQMTENLNGPNEGLFNDAVLINGGANATTFNNYNTYFTKMKNNAAGQGGSAVTDYFNTGPSDDDRADAANGTKVYFSPRAGSTSSTDTMLNLLQNVDCSRKTQNTTYGTAKGRTVVRVAMSEWSDTDIANRLRDMQNDGCDVNVVFRKDADGGNDAAIKVLTTKVASSSQMGLAYMCDPDTSGQLSFHDKFAYVGGNYSGHDDQPMVFMGSLNYISKGLRLNDNTLLKINNVGLFNTYKGFFANTLNNTTTLAGSLHTITPTAGGTSTLPGC